MPGLSKHQLFAALDYQISPEWRAGITAEHASQVFVNDANSAAAPGYTIAGASLGWRKNIGPWTLNAFARVDNLFDRQYVGSVIVNDGNSRFYEGAPGRNWSTGLSARYQF